MGNSYSISSADLEKYVYSEKGVKDQHPFSGWMALQSQFRVEGLHYFRERLNQAKAEEITEEMKAECAEKLLHDLERVVNRSEAKGWGIPEFQKEFYDELKKESAARSQAYNDFIQACSKELTASRHVPEIASVDALEALGMTKKTEALKEVIDSGTGAYKGEVEKQAKVDLERFVILYKGKDQKSRHISLKDLESGENTSLTGEQRGFIQTCWQQGSFCGGWSSSGEMQLKAFDKGDLLPGSGSENFTPIFIDDSGNSVKIHSRLQQSFFSENDGEMQGVPSVEAALTVDISELKGDEFVPGCSSAKPTMQFAIEEINDSVHLIVPEGLEYSKPSASEKTGHMKISEDIKEEAASAYMSLMHSTDEVEQEAAWDRVKDLTVLNHIIEHSEQEFLDQNKDKFKIAIDASIEGHTDPAEYSRAVELFGKIVTDEDEKKQFGEAKLAGYLSAQREPESGILDGHTAKKIEQGVVEIMGAALEEEKRAALKANAAKIIRTCAAEEGKAMSWGQFRRRLVDNVVDFVSSGGGIRQTKARQIMAEHPEVVKMLKQKLPEQKSRWSRAYNRITGRNRDGGSERTL